MSFGDVIRTLIETAVIIFTIWSVFHEDRFIAFEERIAAYFRRKKLHIVRDNFTCKYERG